MVHLAICSSSVLNPRLRQCGSSMFPAALGSELDHYSHRHQSRLACLCVTHAESTPRRPGVDPITIAAGTAPTSFPMPRIERGRQADETHRGQLVAVINSMLGLPFIGLNLPVHRVLSRLADRLAGTSIRGASTQDYATRCSATAVSVDGDTLAVLLTG